MHGPPGLDRNFDPIVVGFREALERPRGHRAIDRASAHHARRQGACRLRHAHPTAVAAGANTTSITPPRGFMEGVFRVVRRSAPTRNPIVGSAKLPARRWCGVVRRGPERRRTGSLRKDRFCSMTGNSRRGRGEGLKPAADGLLVARLREPAAWLAMPAGLVATGAGVAALALASRAARRCLRSRPVLVTVFEGCAGSCRSPSARRSAARRRRCWGASPSRPAGYGSRRT